MFIVLAAVWSLAAQAAPDAATPAAQVPAPGAKPAKDPVVCRSETPIGTKLPKKVCMLKSERDRQQRESQEALQMIQRSAGAPTKGE